MKIRNLKRNTIDKSLHNVTYYSDIIITVNRTLTNEDLIESVPQYQTSTDFVRQADMFIEGIWFPIIEKLPDLIDSMCYDVDNDKLTFNIYVESISRTQIVNDYINEIKQVLNTLSERDYISVVKADICGYNAITDEMFVIECLKE